MLTKLLKQACRSQSNRPAIVYGDQRISYEQLDFMVENMASIFSEKGVGASDCVAFMLPNSPEFIVSFFACARLHAVALPLNPQYTQEETSRLLADSGARLVISDQLRKPVVEEAVRGLKDVRLLFLEPGSIEFGTSNVFVAPASESEYAGPALYLYTSGSTDSYKRVTCTQENLYFEALNFVEATKLTSDDAILCTIPLYHSYGIGNCMLDAVFCASTLVLMGELSEVPFAACARDVIKLCAKEQVRFFPGVPHQFSILASLPEDNLDDLSMVKLCVSSGDVLPRSTFNRFRARYGGLPIRSLYGSTEAGSIAMTTVLNDNVQFGSLGAPLPNVTIEIRDQEQNPVITGEVGQIWVKSPVIPPTGYDNRPELSSSTFRDGFYATGDIGLLNAAGELVLKGRKQSFVDVAGYKVDTSEVEEVLEDHPLVVEAAALGVEVPNMGTLVKAVLVIKEHATCSETEIRAWCNERLSFFKIPRLIEFRSSLPRNPVGKILKKDLADISLWLKAISAYPGALAERLQNVSIDVARRTLIEFVRGQVGLVLGQAPDMLPIGAGFKQLGMDSLSSLELCARLEYALGRSLSSTIAFDYPTVSALSEALLHRPAAQQKPTDDEDLDELSDAELTKLLAMELSAQETTK